MDVGSSTVDVGSSLRWSVSSCAVCALTAAYPRRWNVTPVTNVEFSLAARLTRQSPRGHRFSLTGLAPQWSPLICPELQAVVSRCARSIM